VNHIFAAVAGARDAIGWRRSQRRLGGENEIIAIRRDKVTDQFLGLAELIGVGGIDKVAAGFNVAIENFFCCRAFGSMSPARAEVAGAKRQFRYAQPRSPSENLVPHAFLLRYGSRLPDEISSTHSCPKRILLNRISMGGFTSPFAKRGNEGDFF